MVAVSDTWLPDAWVLAAGVNEFNARYAQALGARDYDTWLALFDETCEYYLQSRENADAGLPLATLRFESKGMLRDRVYGVQNTLFHAPYFQRHIFGPATVSADELLGEERLLSASCSYVVIRTKENDAVGELYSAGRCNDRFVLREGGLLLRERRIVFDTALILNSLIHPL